VLLLLLLLGLVVAVRGRRPEPSPLRAAALIDRLTGTESAPPQERRRQVRELRETLAQLSPREQTEFWDDRRRRFCDWLDDFFRAPADEQAVRLDDEIARMRDFRRQAEGEGDDSTNGPGEEELRRRQKIWLDLTTAEERALVDQYLGMLSQRQQQFGQSGFSPWGDVPP
jgi:hypothetical protein